MIKDELSKIRLTDSEKRGFLDAADRVVLRTSSWAWERLRRVASRELEGAAEKAAFLQAKLLQD